MTGKDDFDLYDSTRKAWKEWKEGKGKVLPLMISLPLHLAIEEGKEEEDTDLVASVLAKRKQNPATIARFGWFNWTK
jgi:hypothetical protein